MPRGSPNVRLQVKLDPDLDVKLRAILASPLTGRIQYGSISALINHLLLDWVVKEMERRKATPPHGSN
jgi:hypothetical protein